MERDVEGSVSSQTQRVNTGRSTSPSRVRTGSDPFLVTCRCFSVVTALAAILCIVVNVYSAVRSFKNGYDVFDGIFRCYAVVIAVIVVVAETEWRFFIKFWKVLEFSAGRGMLQIFVAVMTRAYPEDYGQRNDLILLRNIASYFLLTCGAIYVISVSSGNHQVPTWKSLVCQGPYCCSLYSIRHNPEEYDMGLVSPGPHLSPVEVANVNICNRLSLAFRQEKSFQECKQWVTYQFRLSEVMLIILFWMVLNIIAFTRSP